MDTTIDEIKARLIELHIVKPEDFAGCTDEQIEQIKQTQGVNRLPLIFEQFLLKMGQSAGLYLGGSGFYPELLNMKVEALEILQDDNAQQPLPADAFVFLTHEGYEIFYFGTNDNSDDPPVYEYHDNLKTFTQKFERLSDYFLKQLEWAEQNYPRRS